MSAPLTYYAWLQDVKKNRPSERIGQAFINDFIKGVWTELYYTEDEKKAEEMIFQWLGDMHYYEELPEKVDPVYQSIRLPFTYPS